MKTARRIAAQESIKALCERAIGSRSDAEFQETIAQLRAEIGFLTHNLSLEAENAFFCSRYSLRDDGLETF